MKRFLSFDFYETFICYRGCLNLNSYMSKKVQKNFLVGLKVWSSWGSRFFFSKSPLVGRFSFFHAKLQVFWGGFSFLGQFFSQFFVIFSSKTWVFSGAGWSFWVKKTLFFLAKLQFLRGWMLFLGTFFVNFLSFFHAKFLFFARLGGLFESKKTKIFCETSVFERLDALFEYKTDN